MDEIIKVIKAAGFQSVPPGSHERHAWVKGDHRISGDRHAWALYGPAHIFASVRSREGESPEEMFKRFIEKPIVRVIMALPSPPPVVIVEALKAAGWKVVDPEAPFILERERWTITVKHCYLKDTYLRTVGEFWEASLTADADGDGYRNYHHRAIDSKKGPEEALEALMRCSFLSTTIGVVCGVTK